MENWQSSFINFITTGNLGTVHAGMSLDEVLNSLNYESKNDTFISFPTFSHDTFRDTNLTLTFSEDKLVTIAIGFDERLSAPKEMYGIIWYSQVVSMSISILESLLKEIKIPYWRILYVLDGEPTGDVGLQTKGLPCTLIQPTMSNDVWSVTFSMQGFDYPNEMYAKKVEPDLPPLKRTQR